MAPSFWGNKQKVVQNDFETVGFISFVFYSLIIALKIFPFVRQMLNDCLIQPVSVRLVKMKPVEESVLIAKVDQEFISGCRTALWHPVVDHEIYLMPLTVKVL